MGNVRDLWRGGRDFGANRRTGHDSRGITVTSGAAGPHRRRRAGRQGLEFTDPFRENRQCRVRGTRRWICLQR
jgi:hypothetical protein